MSVVLLTGCNLKDDSSESKKNNDNKNVSIESEESSDTIKKKIQSGENAMTYEPHSEGTIIDNRVVDERYDNVKKEYLTYDSYDPNTISFEYDNGFASSSPLQDEKPVNEKQYVSILRGYTYFREIGSIDISYEEAIEKAKKLLPDDIVEVRKIEDTDFSIEYIFYESSKGNFVVGFAGSHMGEDRVAGITYMKEL